MAKILFSAIGTSDPIRNLHDSGWLHCMRFVRPEKTIIYLTKMICGYEDRHGLYSNTVKLLNQQLAEYNYPPIELEIERREDMDKPHLNGELYEDFKTFFMELHRRFPEDELYVNCSSGTPAIKSCLEDLRFLLPFGKEINFLQVDAPNDGKDYNDDRVDDSYNLVEHWEANYDHGFEGPWRVHPLPVSQHDRMMRAEYAKVLIRQHEYIAARQLIEKDLQDGEGGRIVQNALDGADQRKMRLLTAASRNLAKAGIAFSIPKDENKKILHQCAEQILSMINDERSHDYDNMLRKITPVLFYLAVQEIYTVKGWYVEDYQNIWKKYKNGVVHEKKTGLNWSKIEAEHPDFITAIGGIPKSSYIYFGQLRKYIDAIEKNPEIKLLFSDLGKVDDARNLAAHELQGINNTWIKEYCGFTAKEILKNLKKLIGLIAPEYNDDYWKDYESMDLKICELLDEVRYSDGKSN